MKRDPKQVHLSRRERQIMDVIYSRGQATALEVLEGIPNAPSYSAVRALLAILERKGHVKHTKVSNKYVFTATRSANQAAKAALRDLVQVYYDGSTEKTLEALLQNARPKPTKEECERMAKLLKNVK